MIRSDGVRGSHHRSTVDTLSIITVCFDDDDGVQITLDSILEQSDNDLGLEVIVVDGSESPGTSIFFETFRSKFVGTAILISEPDMGVYDAMNKGTDRASGRYVQYLNSGDSFMNIDSLRILQGALLESPDWLVSGAYHGLGTGSAQVKIQSLPFRRYRHLYGMQPHCHQACWFKTDVVRSLGGYNLDVGFVADFDLIIQFAKRSAPAVICSDLVLYEGGGLSSKGGDSIPKLIGAVRSQRVYGGNSLLIWFDRCFVLVQSTRRRSQKNLRAACGHILRWRHRQL